MGVRGAGRVSCERVHGADHAVDTGTKSVIKIPWLLLHQFTICRSTEENQRVVRRNTNYEGVLQGSRSGGRL